MTKKHTKPKPHCALCALDQQIDDLVDDLWDAIAKRHRNPRERRLTMLGVLRVGLSLIKRGETA